MKLFTCSVCQQLLFFENVQCSRCGHRLAYVPERAIVSALEPDNAAPGVFVALAPEIDGERYKLCANTTEHGVCNWALAADSADRLCRACRLNRIIPNLASAEVEQAWHRVEVAKRRLLYTLMQLGLSTEAKSGDDRGLAFELKQEVEGEKVVTGHNDGIITIDLAEADDSHRERTRKQLGEEYRTVLGHFRHEAGHYYWARLVSGSRWHEPFGALFGDERADYEAARERHYANGAPRDWPQRFVSMYASMHPWEDWAETFAHYLHMVDTLETARSYGVALSPPPGEGAPIPALKTRSVHAGDFDALIGAWLPLTIMLNSLNRSMGLADPYPFVLSDAATAKLRFVHDLVASCHE